MGRGKRWVPSSVEQRALDHLESESAWQWLGFERPDESERVGWRPFLKIFGFNVIVFLPVFLLLVVFGWHSMAADDPSMSLDAPTVLGLVAMILLPSAMAAAVVTGLYRRSWNRRARNLERESDEEPSSI
ncbi:hypothetical protein BH11ARM2_BH11ARM2_23900 [soil metagenome]